MVCLSMVLVALQRIGFFFEKFNHFSYDIYAWRRHNKRKWPCFVQSHFSWAFQICNCFCHGSLRRCWFWFWLILIRKKMNPWLTFNISSLITSYEIVWHKDWLTRLYKVRKRRSHINTFCQVKGSKISNFWVCDDVSTSHIEL